MSVSSRSSSVAQVSASVSLSFVLSLPLFGCSGPYLPVGTAVDDTQSEGDAAAPSPETFSLRASGSPEVDTNPVLSGHLAFEGELTVRGGIDVGAPGNVVCEVEPAPYGKTVDVTCTFSFRPTGSKVTLLGFGSNPSGTQGGKVNVELACIRMGDAGPCATYHLGRESPVLRSLLNGTLWATVRTEWWPEGEIQGALR